LLKIGLSTKVTHPIKAADKGEDGFIGIGPVAHYPPNGYGSMTWPATSGSGRTIGIARITMRDSSPWEESRTTRKVLPLCSSEPTKRKKAQRGGSFLCTDQYCSRYIVGTRGKGEVSTGTNHLGFRCVKDASVAISPPVIDRSSFSSKKDKGDERE